MSEREQPFQKTIQEGEGLSANFGSEVSTPAPSSSPRSLDSDPVLGRSGAVRSVSHMREWARQWVAIIIVSCLAITVILSFVLIVVLVIWDHATPSDAKDIVSLVIGPVVGIVGAVTGFYFSKMQDIDDDSDNGD